MYGGIGSGDVLAIGLLAMIIFSHALLAHRSYHFNHYFTTMFNTKDALNDHKPKHDKFVLELYAVILHNDTTTNIGCAAVDIPTTPGEHELEISTWIPIARSSVGTTHSRLHYYYLGSSLDNIRPTDLVQTMSNEQDWTKSSSPTLLSKHDLHSETSGTVNVRVSVANNNFRREGVAFSGSQSQRVFLRETVDEVLTRVRKNKRHRMTSI